LGRLLAAAIVVGIQGDIGGSRAAVVQLPGLVCTEAVSQRAGNVAKTCLPQHSVVAATGLSGMVLR